MYIWFLRSTKLKPIVSIRYVFSEDLIIINLNLKARGIVWLADDLLASQEGLCLNLEFNLKENISKFQKMNCLCLGVLSFEEIIRY
jgi:hypothetical protein